MYWRRKWQPTPVLLPGESHGQRSLLGYSLWGFKELDMIERWVGTSLVAQWLRLCASTAGGTDLIPGQGTRSYMLARVGEGEAMGTGAPLWKGRQALDAVGEL